MYNCPSLGPMLGKLRLIHSLTLSILIFHFNIILTYRLSTRALMVTFSDQDVVYMSHDSNTCFVSCQPYPPSFYGTNIW